MSQRITAEELHFVKRLSTDNLVEAALCFIRNRHRAQAGQLTPAMARRELRDAAKWLPVYEAECSRRGVATLLL